MSEDLSQLPNVSGTLSLNLQGNIINVSKFAFKTLIRKSYR